MINKEQATFCISELRFAWTQYGLDTLLYSFATMLKADTDLVELSNKDGKFTEEIERKEGLYHEMFDLANWLQESK